MLSLNTLPIDVILTITPHLDVPALLALTSTCKALHDPAIAHSQYYWRCLLARTFRLAQNPSATFHGRQWHHVYRRLLTQGRLYAWGQHSSGQRGSATKQSNLGTPHQMENLHDIGIVADLQATGWGTCFLNSEGHLYVTGILDGLSATMQKPVYPFFQKLSFPDRGLLQGSVVVAGSPSASLCTTIRKFSAGRSRLVAQADDRTIWIWHDFNHVATNLGQLFADRGFGPATAVKNIVAGWSSYAACINGIGLVIFDVIFPDPAGDTTSPDLVVHGVVPGTDLLGDNDIGHIKTIVLLEAYVLYMTVSGALHAAAIDNDGLVSIDTPFMVPLQSIMTAQGLISSVPEDGSVHPSLVNVQGQFRQFALFLNTDNVLVGDTTILRDINYALTEVPSEDTGRPTLRFDCMPGLQKTKVVSVAFGDYHYLALHADGTVTSYGRDCHNQGNLGLGRLKQGGEIRGIVYEGFSMDGDLRVSDTGRQVWFDRILLQWVRSLEKELETHLRRLNILKTAVAFEISEWIERKCRAWAVECGNSHFAIAVAACGWHSGAIVLVDGDCQKRRQDNGASLPGMAELLAEVIMPWAVKTAG